MSRMQTMKQRTSHVIRHLAPGVTTAMFADAMLDVRDQSSARVLAGSTEFDFTCTSESIYANLCKLMKQIVHTQKQSE